jgi:hypothetical protein
MDVKIEKISIAKLIPYAANSRTHSDAQVAQIAASIREFGWTNPVLLDGANGIIAGHGRVMAAQKLGEVQVPTIELGHMTDTQKRAYIIADNKIAMNSGWDAQMLALEIGDLRNLGTDLELLGFSAADFSRMQDDTDLDRLNVMMDDGEDEDLDALEHSEPKKSSGTQEKNKAELFPLSVMLEHEQRNTVFQAIRKAKQQHGLETSSQAIWVICKEYLNESV